MPKENNNASKTDNQVKTEDRKKTNPYRLKFHGENNVTTKILGTEVELKTNNDIEKECCKKAVCNIL